MDNLSILVEKENIEVCAVGGNINRKNRFSYGGEAREQLMKIRFDAAFLGAAAISEDGIYFEEKEDADVKRIAASQSRESHCSGRQHKISEKEQISGITSKKD